MEDWRYHQRQGQSQPLSREMPKDGLGCMAASALRDGKDFLHLCWLTFLSQMKQLQAQHRFCPAERPRSALVAEKKTFSMCCSGMGWDGLSWHRLLVRHLGSCTVQLPSQCGSMYPTKEDHAVRWTCTAHAMLCAHQRLTHVLTADDLPELILPVQAGERR